MEEGNHRRVSPRKRAQMQAALEKATALKQVMDALDREEQAAKKKETTSSLTSFHHKSIKIAHDLALQSQHVFITRIEASKNIMDLLQCVLDLEELLANVQNVQKFNNQQIRRDQTVVHTNYIMLPLFPTPIPDDLMKTPQLSMVAARIYNIEYAIRVLFTSAFDDEQRKKYYKKRKFLGSGRGYHLQHRQGNGKKMKLTTTSAGSKTNNRRGSNKPAVLSGLLTSDGRPIEICTTCSGTSTRKNGSNRGKMQRWCVDCQKSYRVKDAYTALEIQQNAQRIEDEAKAQIRKEEEILRIQMQLDMEREEEEGKKFKSERCAAKCSL